jgi:hypothetical protein
MNPLKTSWTSFGLIASALLLAGNAQATQHVVHEGASSTFPEPHSITEISQQKPSIGIKGGLTSPQGPYQGAAEYGIEAGYQPYIPYSAGVEFTTMSANRSNASNLNRTKILAKVNYNFGGTIPIVRSSFVGAGLGPVFDSERGETVIRPAAGLLAGFDVPLTSSGQIIPDSFSLGANVSYLFVGNNGVNAFGMNALVKYWF